MTAGLELPPGTSVHRRYRIQRILGRGGFGRTYLAADEWRFGELCVLKEFVPSSQGDSVVAQKLHELFHREATILHKLNHPQIPKFFAVFEEDGRLFIAQEYIDGKTCWTILQERLRQGRTFTEAEIVSWLRNLLQVLDYLHRQNIVHRDISPDNIMLSRGRRLPILIDFGVVKQAATHFYGINAADPDGLIQASVSVGKFGYAPYEQIRMGQCSPRSDLYALAVTAVVMLTGKTPNLLIDPQSLEWQWHRLVKIDPHLTKILDMMIAEKPQDRYASAQAVLQDLRLMRRWMGRARSTAVLPQPSPGQPDRKPPVADGSARPDRQTAKTQIEIANLPTARPPTAQPTARPFALPVQTKVWVPTGLSESDLHYLHAGGSPPGSATLIDPPAAGAHPLVNQLKQLIQTPVSFKRILILSALALLPIGGALIGVRSPYITSLCQTLGNCAGEQSQGDYQQSLQQATAAKSLAENAQNLADLQKARDRLADAIAQLHAVSSRADADPVLQQVLPQYQAALQSLDERLERESRAAQLLERSAAEAQKAEEQTKLAKTPTAFAAAQVQWQKTLATLQAVPERTFAYTQAVARSQEYRARLGAVSLHVASSPLPAPSDAVPQATVSVQPQPQQAARQSAAVSVPMIASAPQAVAQKPTPTPVSQPVRSQAAPSTPAVSRSEPRPSTVVARAAQPQSPSFSAGNVFLSATQTLNDVSIWIDGARVNSSGNFVANLVVENHSDRPFGFVPLFAEVRDANNQPVRSRILFGSSGAVVDPGGVMRGEVYVLDRPWNSGGSQDLCLVIREGTSGSRQFRIPF